MKRSGPPARRTPMKRSWLRSTTRRDDCEAVTRDQVFRRDGDCVLKALDPGHRCFGGLTKHELRKRSQGGDPCDLENCIALCSGANGWVEDFPTRAWELGLVIRAGETPADAGRRRSS